MQGRVLRAAALILSLPAAASASHNLPADAVVAPPGDGTGTGRRDGDPRPGRSRRALAEMRSDDGSCHEDMLSSPPGEEVFLAMGLVFSFENAGFRPVDVSALSANLEYNAGLEFDFAVYQMDGFYLARGEDGSVASTSLGTAFDGTGDWQRMASGEGVTLANDFVKDEDGAFLLDFASFGGGGGVIVAPGSVKSFYVKFSVNLLSVDHEALKGMAETEDASVILSRGYRNLKMYVGRVDIFTDSSGLGKVTDEDLENFFTPARFVGKLWSSVACSPTQAPTRTPSQSPMIAATTTRPSAPPSRSPTRSPSRTPSHAPTKSPSVIPTANPTTSTSPPTMTFMPSRSPSISPSSSVAPTLLASARPSLRPSASRAPSFAPSDHPSLQPSVSPSLYPSDAPSTFYNCLTMDQFLFDVWYPQVDVELVKQDIIGNVTWSFRRLFKDTSDVLYPLAKAYDLDFCDSPRPSVELTNATKIKCITNNNLENMFNVCNRFRLTLHFQHDRELDPGWLQSWILQVANRTSGNLTSVYSGSKSVRSDQHITFRNAMEVPEEKRAPFCDAIKAELIESSLLQPYRILAVTCEGWEFVPFDGLFRARNLRRRLQGEVHHLGTLDVSLTVTAEYTYASREEDVEREEEFGGLVEDSINTDRGGILKNLEERQIYAVSGSTVEAREEPRAPPPSPPPVPGGDGSKSNPPQTRTDQTSNSTSETAAITAIIVCSVIGVIIAGFLFYKGMKRSKEEVDELDDEEEKLGIDTSLAEDRTDRAVAPERLVDLDATLASKDDPDVLPANYSGTERNIFGDVVGSSRILADEAREEAPLPQTRGWVGEKIEIHDAITTNESTNRNQGNRGWVDEKVEIHDAITTNERTNRNQGNQGWVDEKNEIHDAITSNERSNRTQGQSDDKNIVLQSSGNSERSIGSFEQRLRAKADRGSIKAGFYRQRSSSVGAVSRSQRKLDEFDLRVRQKLEGRNDMKHSASHNSLSALNSYEEKIAKKMSTRYVSSEDSHSQASGTPADLDDPRQRKLEGGRGRQRSRSPATQARQLSFEEKVARKISRNSGDSHGSTSSSSASFNRRRSSSLDAGMSTSRRKLMEFDARVQQKLERSGMQSRRNPSPKQDPLSAMDKLENPENERSLESSRLEDYNSRLQEKLLQGARGRQRSGSPAPQAQAGKENRRNISALDSYNDRILRKIGNDQRSEPQESVQHNQNSSTLQLSRGITRQRSASLRAAVSRSQLDDFDAKLARKLRLKEREERSADIPKQIQVSVSNSSLSALEARVREKSREHDRLTRQTPTRVDSYNTRLQKKIEEGQGRQRAPGTSSSVDRSISIGARSQTPTRLDSYNTRLQKKMEGGRGRQRGHISGEPAPGSSSSVDRSVGARSQTPTRLDSYNTRLQKKMEEGQGRQRGRSGQPAPGSSSSVEGRSNRNAGLTRQRSKSLGDELSRSQKQLADFNAKLERKRQRGQSGQRAPSQLVPLENESPTRLDSYNTRLQKKMEGERGRQRGRSEEPAPGSSSSVEGRSKRNAGLTRQRSRSLGDELSRSQKQLADFNAKLERKLRQRGQSGQRAPSQLVPGDSESARLLNELDARITAKSTTRK